MKLLIKAAGLNYRELAKRLGTTSAHVTYWNQGKVEPGFKTACRIARELGVTLDELADSLGYLANNKDEESTDQETETE